MANIAAAEFKETIPLLLAKGWTSPSPKRARFFVVEYEITDNETRSRCIRNFRSKTIDHAFLPCGITDPSAGIRSDDDADFMRKHAGRRSALQTAAMQKHEKGFSNPWRFDERRIFHQ
jgi:hypothetical protein